MTSLQPTAKQAQCRAVQLLSFVGLLLVSRGLCNPAALSEAVSAAYHRPVSVELINYIEVPNFHAGSSFFVKMVNDWAGAGLLFGVRPDC